MKKMNSVNLKTISAKTRVRPLFFALATILSSTCYSQSIQPTHNSTLLDYDEEVITLNGTAWHRKYGEKEYVLTPSMSSIEAYRKRIQALDNPLKGEFKSTFRFAKIDASDLVRDLLSKANIRIPDDLTGAVNVYLPQIDIDMLEAKGVRVQLLDEYGNKIRNKNIAREKSSLPAAVIFSEGFESATIPGSVYGTTVTGIANCGWKDVSCYKHTGAKSAWCAGNGGGCNALCTQYANDMGASFYKSTSINTSSYQNLVFKWWMDYDFTNSGTNDLLYKYWWLGSNWSLSPTSYNSSSAEDGLLWKQHTATFTGNPSVFSYYFEFSSNSVGTDYGVYIDDIELSGTLAIGIKEDNNNICKLNFFPNPNEGRFSVSPDNDIVLKLTNDLGAFIQTIKLQGGSKENIDISHLPNGIYFLTGNNVKETVREKIILLKN